MNGRRQTVVRSFNCNVCIHLNGRVCKAFGVIFPPQFSVHKPNDMCDYYKKKEDDLANEEKGGIVDEQT